jgi:hypothetical protein
VPGARFHGAVDHVQLLGGNRQIDKNHGRNASPRRADARRDLQITDGGFYPCLRQRGRLLRVADQDPHRLTSLSKQPRFLRAPCQPS